MSGSKFRLDFQINTVLCSLDLANAMLANTGRYSSVLFLLQHKIRAYKTLMLDVMRACSTLNNNQFDLVFIARARKMEQTRGWAFYLYIYKERACDSMFEVYKKYIEVYMVMLKYIYEYNLKKMFRYSNYRHIVATHNLMLSTIFLYEQINRRGPKNIYYYVVLQTIRV